ncbi:MAG: filamentous hemagglutinin N-terminal domain-containing protein [Vampirovibrionales bacterium]|nr:filamentous hemagglutinin N-terminal domain-containing protein [Vampirovibrionales bacterium]
MAASPCFALPTGYEVVSGEATFVQNGSNTLNINATTDNVIIHYQTFNVGTNEFIHFNLPSASSSVLNQVLGGGASQILGQLTSNGQVYLVNPAGIQFGPAAQVNVGALVASTLNMKDADFLAGKMVFSQLGTPEKIINNGTIAVTDKGFIVLAGGAILNTGTLSSPQGQIALAVGQEVTFSPSSFVDLNLVVNKPLAQAVANTTAAIQQEGQLLANGGAIALQANLVREVYRNAINNTGIVEAQSMISQNGKIVFKSNLDSGSIIENTGRLDVSGGQGQANGGTINVEGSVVQQQGDLLANSSDANGIGGKITVLGESIALYKGSLLSANGANGGGSIRVGGDYQGQGSLPHANRLYADLGSLIQANSTRQGNGGSIVLWSDDATWFHGQAQAKGGLLGGNGGLVEVSSKNILHYDGEVDTSAPLGRQGQLLLDPTDLRVVDASTGSSNTSTLSDVNSFADPNLGAGETRIVNTAINASVSDVTLQATRDLWIEAPINITQANVGLTATANRTMNVLSSVQTNGGDINFLADADADGVGDLNLLGGGPLSVAFEDDGSTYDFNNDTIADDLDGNGQDDYALFTTSRGGNINLSGANIIQNDYAVNAGTGTLNYSITQGSGDIYIQASQSYSTGSISNALGSTVFNGLTGTPGAQGANVSLRTKTNGKLFLTGGGGAYSSGKAIIATNGLSNQTILLEADDLIFSEASDGSVYNYLAAKLSDRIQAELGQLDIYGTSSLVAVNGTIVLRSADPAKNIVIDAQYDANSGSFGDGNLTITDTGTDGNGNLNPAYGLARFYTDHLILGSSQQTGNIILSGNLGDLPASSLTLHSTGTIDSSGASFTGGVPAVVENNTNQPTAQEALYSTEFNLSVEPNSTPTTAKPLLTSILDEQFVTTGSIYTQALNAPWDIVHRIRKNYIEPKEDLGKIESQNAIQQPTLGYLQLGRYIEIDPLVFENRNPLP